MQSPEARPRIDTRQKTPLTPENRLLLVGETVTLLESPTFGWQEYGKFTSNMIDLLGEDERRDYGFRSSNPLIDKEMNVLIFFTRGFPRSFNLPEGEHMIEVNGDGLQRITLSDEPEPRFEIYTAVTLAPTTYSSYVTGEQEKVDERYHEDSSFITNEQAQKFCHRLFDIYQNQSQVSVPQE